MKHVVSVSLGSSRRDHSVETEFAGERFLIRRIGTDGDMKKAESLIKDLDGKVDAMGMGGIDLYIQAGKRRYTFKDARRLASAAKKTPIVDGTGLKNTLERNTIRYLNTSEGFDLKNKKVLLVCGVDRFGMAEALEEAGADVSFGDLIFGLNLPIMIRSLRTLEKAAKLLGPIVSRLPFQYLYPTGDKQETSKDKYGDYYRQNEIIAGDFHYIKKYLPQRIDHKTIITNTVTREDVKMLKEKGAACLITTTPELEGRSFGTNVMEAVLIVLLDKPLDEICEEDYEQMLEKVRFLPRIIHF